ncbi:ligand-binding sensor domain-containing protein [Pedobacter endophyticus]|uniref:histidine kinase n=1 Tax=Pedobacter endophyticus TaxID=2789740 RepID=A0A7S9KY60_9SPHI|nr:sensor histidine kinase [Pedobacter endophyticus]QPH38980.1 hybrid sensor histidine kinase/response regulator [Pedobacter endophyticus]
MKLRLVFIFVFISAVSFAQNPYVFKHLNVEDGLSQSSVLSIAQDAKGFMWFGTRFGLNKYDSKNFKTYFLEKGNPNSLTSSQYINTILCLKNGTLLIGTPAGLNKYNETSDNFERFQHNANDIAGISNNLIRHIYQDRQNRVWIGTGNGLNLLDPNKKYRFKHFLVNKVHPQDVYQIYQDHTGTIWLGTSKGLMSMLINKGGTRFKHFKNFSDSLDVAVDNHITSIAEDGNDNLWIGTKQTGLYKLNLITHQITNYTYSILNTKGISSNNIRKITQDKAGKLWIATLHGINIYDPKSKSFSTIQNEPGNPSSLSQNSVYAIFQDRQGIVWVGSYFGAVSMVYPNYTPFNVYASSNTSSGLSSQVVSSIMEGGNRNLWIGTEGEGLNYYNSKTNSYIHYKYDPNNRNSLSSNLVKAIIKDRQNRIWIGTHLGGLNEFKPETNSFVRYTSHKNDTSSLGNDEITSLFEDSYGRFWVGTNSGLNSFDASAGKFIRNRINGLEDAVNYIFEDSKRTLWVATNTGLHYLKNNESRFKRRTADSPEKLKYNEISCITEDKLGFLWLGTARNGLFKLYPDQHAYSQTTKLDGLPSNNIMGILQDDSNNLWISTDNGLCKYNPQQKTFKTYNTKDGLPGNEFNQKSFLRDRSGTFYFGGLSGMISFRPDEIKENTSTQPVIFTGLKLFGKPVSINANSNLLNANISTVKSITFKPEQDVFTVEFTLLNFIKPEKNRYAYKLDGFEKNWNYVANPAASYTNLSPGHYTLLVKASNNDGIWTKQLSRLNIEVLPPYYRTWWAYLSYVCIVAAIFILLVRYLLIRAVLTREKEINEHKLEFFTNISHEIRTPLTLIVGPLETLIEKSQNEPQWSKALQPIKNNADRLMRLVTELLDFRKAESGKMQLHVSPGNVVKFCREIFIAFQNMAIAKQIDYQFTAEREEIELYFDKVQMEKVLFNLLSNAFKFTPDK